MASAAQQTFHRFMAIKDRARRKTAGLFFLTFLAGQEGGEGLPKGLLHL